MIAANPLSPPFRALLDAIGAVLAFLYQHIPNYGVDIILLTLGIRVLLLPLAVKQIRSMQAMASIQPKLREIQRKYKGKRDAASRQKQMEEQQKLYREHGVNPFGGCLPVLAQFPILIALFGVLNVPNGLPHIRGTAPQAPVTQYTRLYRDISQNGQAPGINFVGANLICSAREAGTRADSVKKTFSPHITEFQKDCGKGWPARIPFYFFLAAMIGTTYYQQRQMQRASPGQNQQQQMLTRIMPIFFGFIGINFPAGLVIYWTTTNLVQIVQQSFMLPKGAGAPRDGDRPGRTGGVGSAGRRGDGPRRPAGERRPPQGEGKSDRGSERAPRESSGTGDGSAGPGRGSSQTGGRGGGNRKKRRKR